MTAREGPSAETASRVRVRWRAAAPSPTSEASFAVLPAKLRPPQPRVHLVERRALLGALGETKAPLVVLCAPAGAGKTTVLRQWAESDERPFAWVQLDEADSDPVVLLSFLALALEPITDVDPSVRASLSLAVPPVRERILPLVGEALAAAPGFVLVLDDAHMLSGDKSWEVVAFVLRNLPEGAQLALGSRSDPDLPLARMRAAGEVAEFHAAELSLLPRRGRRAHAPARLRGGPGDGGRRLRRHRRLGHGPAAGVPGTCRPAAGGVAAPDPGQQARDRRVPDLGGAGRAAARRPGVPAAHLRAAGAHAAPVRAGHRAATTAGSSSPASPARSSSSCRSATTAATTATTTSSPRCCATSWRGGTRAWPEELHRAVAEWYAEEDLPDAAVQHLLAAGDAAAAGDVVAAAWPAMWSRGQVETVRRWLGAFTDRQILNHPALTLTAGWVYTALDAGRLGERWCEAACASPMDDSPVAGRRRVAALVAGAAARHRRRRRRAAHARGRRAGRAARDHAGHQLVRRRPGGARRGALALGGDPARRCTRSRSAPARARSATRPPSWRRWATLRSSPPTRPSGTSPRSTRRGRPTCSPTSGSARTAAACRCC